MTTYEQIRAHEKEMKDKEVIVPYKLKCYDKSCYIEGCHVHNNLTKTLTLSMVHSYTFDTKDSADSELGPLWERKQWLGYPVDATFQRHIPEHEVTKWDKDKFFQKMSEYHLTRPDSIDFTLTEPYECPNLGYDTYRFYDQAACTFYEEKLQNLKSELSKLGFAYQYKWYHCE